MNGDNTTQENNGKNTHAGGLESVTPAQLRNAGLGEVGYIRPVFRDGAVIFVACAADGSRLSLHESHAEAHLALRTDYNLGVIPLQ